MNFLNRSIHRLHPQTESDTAVLAGPVGGFEYVDTRRADSDLTPADHAALESRWIDPETARRAGLRRVDSLTGGEIVGRRGGGDYSGILIPYFLPGTDKLRDYRLRRDYPDLEYGAAGRLKAKRKYLSPPRRSNMLYFPPGVRQSHLGDPMLPLVITEGEFKTLALWRAANHGAARLPRFLPLGVSGIYNWRGTIGKTVGPDGSRMDVKGAIPDLDWLVWAGRRVVIAYDADAVSKELVRIARSALAAHLRGRDALVGFLEWGIERGKGIDDHLAAVGPDVVLDEIAHVDFTGSAWKKDLLRSKPTMNTTEGRILPVLAPRGTPGKRPMRDTSKPANGIRQDKVVITQGHMSRQRKSSQGFAMIGYSDSTWAEDMAPQGCDQSADPAAGNAWAARAAFAAFLAGKR